MSQTLIDTGSDVLIRGFNVPNVVNRPAPYVYTIKETKEGFHLERDRPRFNVPKDIMGELPKQAEAIYQGYRKAAAQSTSVLLTGIKGIGKSLLAETICNKAIDATIPVIILKTPYAASDLYSIIKTVGECVIFIDEFEKLYKANHQPTYYGPGESTPGVGPQDDFLSILSDTSLRGVMFILTSNDARNVNEYIKDRPGRVRYRINFDIHFHQFFKQMLGDRKILPEIMEYLEYYFAYYTDQTRIKTSGRFGFDAIEMLINLALEADSLEAFKHAMVIVNVPDNIHEQYQVTEVRTKSSTENKSFGGYIVPEIIYEDNKPLFRLTVFDEDLQPYKVCKFPESLLKQALIFEDPKKIFKVYRINFDELVITMSGTLVADNAERFALGGRFSLNPANTTMAIAEKEKDSEGKPLSNYRRRGSLPDYNGFPDY